MGGDGANPPKPNPVSGPAFFADNTDVDYTICLDEWHVYNSLRQLKRTASRYDNLPYWLFKHCANVITHVVTYTQPDIAFWSLIKFVEKDLDSQS
jgi:hypothetical protein